LGRAAATPDQKTANSAMAARTGTNQMGNGERFILDLYGKWVGVSDYSSKAALSRRGALMFWSVGILIARTLI
jgi:hypothetical protein